MALKTKQVILTFFCLMSIVACGQKGALYYPAEPANNEQEVPQEAGEQSGEPDAGASPTENNDKDSIKSTADGGKNEVD